MPDYFTHAITAHRIYDRLERRHKDAIKNADLYLLGAQGGDVFFTYKLTYRGNMGRALHVMDNVRLFSHLAKKSTSYAAGFAAHYALDCTLHPVIYAFERLSRAPFSHIRFEGDIGLFVSRKYGIPRRIMPPERILRCSFSVYDSIRTAVPEVTLCGIEHSIAPTVTEYSAVIQFPQLDLPSDVAQFASVSGDYFSLIFDLANIRSYISSVGGVFSVPLDIKDNDVRPVSLTSVRGSLLACVKMLN